jgi:hypothetical protein
VVALAVVLLGGGRRWGEVDGAAGVVGAGVVLAVEVGALVVLEQDEGVVDVVG